MKRAEVVDLLDERLARMEPGTRFILDVRDAGSDPNVGVFEWRWRIEDREGCDQYRPTSGQIAGQLRRIADVFDRRVVKRGKRHRVRPRHG